MNYCWLWAPHGGNQYRRAVLAPGNINTRTKNSWEWKETQVNLGKNQDGFFMENEAAEQKKLGQREDSSKLHHQMIFRENKF